MKKLLGIMVLGLMWSSISFAETKSPEPPYDIAPEEHNYHHKLLSHPRVSVTPHIGASTVEAQMRVVEELVIGIKEIILDRENIF